MQASPIFASQPFIVLPQPPPILRAADGLYAVFSRNIAPFFDLVRDPSLSSLRLKDAVLPHGFIVSRFYAFVSDLERDAKEFYRQNVPYARKQYLEDLNQFSFSYPIAWNNLLHAPAVGRKCAHCQEGIVVADSVSMLVLGGGPSVSKGDLSVYQHMFEHFKAQSAYKEAPVRMYHIHTECGEEACAYHQQLHYAAVIFNSLLACWDAHGLTSNVGSCAPPSSAGGSPLDCTHCNRFICNLFTTDESRRRSLDADAHRFIISFPRVASYIAA